MKIALGSDHGGLSLKDEIKGYLNSKNIEVYDYGTFTEDAVDYPDIAKPVCESVLAKQFDFGILVCGTGIGISIAANKIKGIRAACCSDGYTAKLTRSHNDANILCLGGRVIGPGLAFMIVDAFLGEQFEGGRHSLRIEKINRLEENGR
ncbi:MAG: ribose 5-phosphate isomerase B [Clostridiales bacterium]|jgi:ribose 5-phosphate isomerase B|nr:ribose 5-phosphate isomerase B [Clostridiales bacterium]